MSINWKTNYCFTWQKSGITEKIVNISKEIEIWGKMESKLHIKKKERKLAFGMFFELTSVWIWVMMVKNPPFLDRPSLALKNYINQYACHSPPVSRSTKVIAPSKLTVETSKTENNWGKRSIHFEKVNWTQSFLPVYWFYYI